MNIILRKETEKDYRAVEELTRAAFWNLYEPGCHEHFILHNLRKSVDFIPELDFLAEKEGQITGQIIYTRGVIQSASGLEKVVICFGPVSVRPDFQKQGIGSALINHSLSIARLMRFPAVCIYGDPRYYHRFGFRCAEKWDIQTADGKYAVALMVLELQAGALHNFGGRFIESASFQVDEPPFAEYEATFPPREKCETDSQREFKLLASLLY